jgi:type I restriction enzyme S subunit
MISKAWATVPLGEHCSKIGSGVTPRGGESVYIDDGVALIRSQNVYNGHFKSDGLAHLSEEHAEELNGVTVEAGDVLLNITGDSVARSCLAPQGVLPARVNQHVAIIRPNPVDFDSRFLGYFLISPFMQSTMLSLAGSGGTRKALTKNMIERFCVPKPARPVQERIADILSAYDDLIENNRRRMALLEEAARQLYREWFARLRFPGHEHTRIIDGLPEGWERRPLGGCAEFLSGGTPSKGNSEYWNGEIPWVSSGELTSVRVHDTKLHVTSEAVEAGSRLVAPGTILVVVRGMSLAKEFRMAMVSRDVSFNQDLKALVAQPGVAAVYLFHALEMQREQIRDRATEASHGTKKLDTPVLAAVPILVPTNQLQKHFQDIVEPSNSQWDNLYRQNEKLCAARDLLLPRLMSGELAV